MWKAFVISYILAALMSFVDVSQYKIAEIAFEKVHNEEIVYVEHKVEYAKLNFINLSLVLFLI